MIYLQTPPLYEEFIQVKKHLKSQQNKCHLLRLTGNFEEDMIFSRPNNYKEYNIKKLDIQDATEVSCFNPEYELVKSYMDKIFCIAKKRSSESGSSED